jgi:hypothetical protein
MCEQHDNAANGEELLESILAGDETWLTIRHPETSSTA